MKTVIITRNEVGLVYRHGVYQHVLTEGRYFFWGAPEVRIYSRYAFIPAPDEWNEWASDPLLAAMFDLRPVGEGQLLLVFENGLLRHVVPSGRYLFWKGAVDYGFELVDTSVVELPLSLNRTLRQHPLLAPYVRHAEVQPHEGAVLFIDGRFVGVLGPGTYTWWKNAVPVQLVRADLRQQQLEVNGQEILTRDKAALRINAWAQFRVTDIETAVLKNKDYERQLYVSVQLALRGFVGGYSFDELLDKKDELEPYVLDRMKGEAAALGVQLESFGIRDIILPGDVKEIMNSVLVAEKKAQATIILRREETASTRSLLNTARLMEDNPMLWKLKQMEYVEKIAEKVGHINVSSNHELGDQLRKLFIP